MMSDRIMSALRAIHVAEVTRDVWIAVGMALKQENYPCSVWDEWSQNDDRYIPGECERLWESFHGSSHPVRGGTIIQIAKQHGWIPSDEDGCLDWNDTVEAKEGSIRSGLDPPQDWNPVQDLCDYLRLLFEPSDRVSFVTEDVKQDGKRKWVPRKGVYDRSAGELIESLQKHPEDIRATIGDWKPEVGGWIRFNPVDGSGIADSNVTRFRYALVESDSLSLEKQYDYFLKSDLPIAAVVYSGGKSLHAIVHIDAINYEEYRSRVDFLYSYLEDSGFPVDKQNRNPSRLSRLPGVTRNGKTQHLVATGIGRRTWQDWRDSQNEENSRLPRMITLSEFRANPPKTPDELIAGILRCGHKMLLAGPSKAGKSFLLIELCIAIAEGRSWLGFPCRQGKVAYINLEIDESTAVNRFNEIYSAMNIAPKHADSILIWNLRGYAAPLNQLVPDIIQQIKGKNINAVIIDPIYKVLSGDENSATDMALFCNQFDRICAETGSAVICCHHHSKGLQGRKKASDRASGSGVFSRDPDALLDMIQLNSPEHKENRSATAWRIEACLREFPEIEPVNFWFQYPIHTLDEEHELDRAPALGSGSSKRQIAQKKKSKDADGRFRDAYLKLEKNGEVTVQLLAAELRICDKTVYSRIGKLSSEFYLQNSVVLRVKQE